MPGSHSISQLGLQGLSENC